MTKIESSVPMPKPRERRGRPQRYPWESMGVGDSFVARGVSRNSIRTTATYHETRRGWRFQVEPEGANFRVFRIA
jgi:hypothetical protein